MKYLQNEDTIVALSTPMGKGAIAVVRLSGTKCLSIINPLFSKKIGDRHHRRAVKGTFSTASRQKKIDEVVVLYYKGPNSFTGEDVVEISCHCNPIIIDQIIHETLQLEARIARPGEFTERAFFNRKMDLSQAEAVAGIIEAKSRQSLTHSIRQLEGKLSDKISELKKDVMNIASVLEISLDFNEEDVDVYEKQELLSKASQVIEHVNSLMRSFDYGRLLNEGIRMALLGKPNVGKSSLLNAFLNKERAIVSEIPGTTRDYIEGLMEIDGIPIQVIDTAGIRETRDEIEELGVKRTLQQIDTSDVVLALFESNQAADDDDYRLIDYLKKSPATVPVVLVLNKIDLGRNQNLLAELKKLQRPWIDVSAKLGDNIEPLKQLIKDQVVTDGGVEDEEVVITSARHKNALGRAGRVLEDFRQGLAADLDEVILASELRSALDYIGEIVGETTTDDLLNNIFRQFCIGK